jgi:hypothetical protein
MKTTLIVKKNENDLYLLKYINDAFNYTDNSNINCFVYERIIELSVTNFKDTYKVIFDNVCKYEVINEEYLNDPLDFVDMRHGLVIKVNSDKYIDDFKNVEAVWETNSKIDLLNTFYVNTQEIFIRVICESIKVKLL